MKNLMKQTLVLGLLIFAVACGKKETVEPITDLSPQIKNITPQALLNDLVARGMPINAGTTPPKVEGIYISSPHTLEVPYGTDDTYQKGYEFSDLSLRFSNQKDDGSLTIETKNGGTSGIGIGGFLSGSGNKFSIFAELKSVNGSSTATQLRVFTGEITTTGIKDFYTTIIIKDKVDPADVFFTVGKSRIIKDADGMASKTSSFRMAANTNLPNLSSDCAK